MKTKTLHWDYTGPWNYYRRQWRSCLFTWAVLAWEIGMLIWTREWAFIIGVPIIALAACIPFLTYYRSVKPHMDMRARWAEEERAVVAHIEEELARPGTPASTRAILLGERQIHRERVARWTAPTTTIPRRTKELKRQLDEFAKQLEEQP